MRRILLAWELGGGFGHAGPFLNFAPQLLERGHTLHVAAREIAGACQALGDLPVTLTGAVMPEHLWRLAGAAAELCRDPDALRLSRSVNAARDDCVLARIAAG